MCWAHNRYTLQSFAASRTPIFLPRKCVVIASWFVLFYARIALLVFQHITFIKRAYLFICLHSWQWIHLILSSTNYIIFRIKLLMLMCLCFSLFRSRRSYYCSCFPGFSGDDCGVGPLCHDGDKDFCENGGICK